MNYRFLNSLDDEELLILSNAFDVETYKNETKLDVIQDLLESNVDLNVAQEVLDAIEKDK